MTIKTAKQIAWAIVAELIADSIEGGADHPYLDELEEEYPDREMLLDETKVIDEMKIIMNTAFDKSGDMSDHL